MRALLAVALLALGASAALLPGALASNCARTSTGLSPLPDLGGGSYLGAQGGLYPGGANERPAAHTEQGFLLARLAVPRNAAGAPDPLAGKTVFLSIGMSNTRSEFAAFLPLATADPLKHPQVVAVNGAIGGQEARRTQDLTADYWRWVVENLTRQNLTPLQVQAVWLKQAVAGPQGAPLDHARELQGYLEAIVQDLKALFPNLWLVYLSSRIYAGYASTTLNPEPYAHASGFSVKWLVESQLNGTLATAEPRRGVAVPWLSWGPYLWADGLAPNAEGLTWACEEFQSDGTHPNGQGSQKVAQRLLDFLHADPTARAWYTYAGSPPS